MAKRKGGRKRPLIINANNEDISNKPPFISIKESNKKLEEFIDKLKLEIKKEHTDWINNWGADLISFEIIDKILGEMKT